MEEILIDEKRYVSSKRAAKLTGYAKDYIGQLCREGRVPARLVGRSWYVLEAAIQDHRFGTKETKQLKPAEAPALGKTWESPRYEASSGEPLPVINRLPVSEAEPVEDSLSEAEDSTQYLHDSWGEWFNHVGKGAAEPESVAVSAEIQEEPEDQGNTPAHNDIAEEEQKIPIHTIYDLPPKDLLPFHHSAERVADELPLEQKELPAGSRGIGRALSGSLKLVGFLLAIASVAVGFIGSGFSDRYMASIEQANVISGILIYNK
jgi:hypothetical protein